MRDMSNMVVWHKVVTSPSAAMIVQLVAIISSSKYSLNSWKYFRQYTSIIAFNQEHNHKIRCSIGWQISLRNMSIFSCLIVDTISQWTNSLKSWKYLGRSSGITALICILICLNPCSMGWDIPIKMRNMSKIWLVDVITHQRKSLNSWKYLRECPIIIALRWANVPRDW